MSGNPHFIVKKNLFTCGGNVNVFLLFKNVWTNEIRRYDVAGGKFININMSSFHEFMIKSQLLITITCKVKTNEAELGIGEREEKKR